MVETPAKSADTITIGMLAQRLDGMDKAINLLQHSMDRMPSPALVQTEVHALKELTEADFKALRELVEAKFDGNKVALDAALKTQKESSDKIENSFAKQFDSVQSSIAVLTKTTNDKIDDLKASFNVNSGRALGAGNLWGVILGGIAAFGTLISIFVLISTQAGSVPGT